MPAEQGLCSMCTPGTTVTHNMHQTNGQDFFFFSTMVFLSTNAYKHFCASLKKNDQPLKILEKWQHLIKFLEEKTCFKKENQNRLKSAKQNESSRLSCKQCEWRQTISNNAWQMPVFTTNLCHTCPLKTASLVWDSLVWYWPLSPLVISRIVSVTINIQGAASGHPRSTSMAPNSQLKSSNAVGSPD